MHPWAKKWASKIIKRKYVHMWEQFDLHQRWTHGVISILDDNIGWVGVEWGLCCGPVTPLRRKEVLLNNTVASGTLSFLLHTHTVSIWKCDVTLFSRYELVQRFQWMHLWHEFLSLTWLSSWVITVTRFWENLTFDLEVKVRDLSLSKTFCIHKLGCHYCRPSRVTTISQ